MENRQCAGHIGMIYPLPAGTEPIYSDSIQNTLKHPGTRQFSPRPLDGLILSGSVTSIAFSFPGRVVGDDTISRRRRDPIKALHSPCRVARMNLTCGQASNA